MPLESDKDMWMVRAGSGGYLFEDFKANDRVTIGWNDVGDLSSVDSTEAIKEFIADKYPYEKKGSIPIIAGELFRFSRQIEIGDQVITYNPSTRTYSVGRFTSQYEYDQSLNDHHHVRHVQWLAEVDRDALSISTKNSLGSTLPLFQIPKAAADEIRSVVERGGVAAETDESLESEELENLQEEFIQKGREFIKDRIADLAWDEMQDLVAATLRSMGYKTRISQAGPDRGRDIMASPDGLGLEEPRIMVEVKHRSGAIGSQQLRSFIGALRPGDKGVYVSTGGFTRDAKYEAERSAIPTSLLDLDDLIDLILQNYDGFDAEGRAILPLRRAYWPL